MNAAIAQVAGQRTALITDLPRGAKEFYFNTPDDRTFSPSVTVAESVRISFINADSCDST